ncbi:hypothetical protein, partial [Burkholderia stabilis]
SIRSCGLLDQGVHIQESGSKGCGQEPPAAHPSSGDGAGGGRATKQAPPGACVVSVRPNARGGPASNGGVHTGSNPVITKTLKKDDSVSLPMFRETLKILKGVSSFVSQCGKSG